jgi:hypothetical protein
MNSSYYENFQKTTMIDRNLKSKSLNTKKYRLKFIKQFFIAEENTKWLNLKK